jgi:CDP-diacylglycerol--serine O-phosphatidyltransferase
MKITRAVVPSLFTVLNMFCGFMSITYASRNDVVTGAWLIILGAIFDSLDGVMARITKSSSAFGVEFDSLSDVVTFGAAPSFLMYQAHLNTLGGIGVLISSMPMIFGGIRLARFNVELVGFDKEYFRGLPIPSQAVTLCSFILIYSNHSGMLTGWRADVLVPMVAVLALLMVSTIKYDTFPKFSKRGIKEHPLKFVFFVLAGVLVVVTRGEALFAVLVFFILTGIVRWFVKTFTTLIKHPARDLEEEPEISSLDV